MASSVHNITRSKQQSAWTRQKAASLRNIFLDNKNIKLLFRGDNKINAQTKHRKLHAAAEMPKLAGNELIKCDESVLQPNKLISSEREH